MLTQNLTQPIYCEQSTCIDHRGKPLSFPSTAAYEAHYEARHRHVCLACCKVFPNDYFLQLHLDEFHDMLLQIRRERGEKVFRCFVQNCKKSFMTPKMRRLHLIDKHHFPQYYDFNIIASGTLSFEERQRHAECKKSSDRMDIVKTKRTRQSNDIETTKDTMDMDELTQQMTRLRIPRSISFGRAKPGLSSTRKKK
ncbi:hypothetical protein BJV82DRAFT_634784 [Fennellomyces sp. T-0311]|nr:hypothetical protein BJV82DRAFT_634784 [Fennellomyces sp. T-0311]